ncbi:MAG: hypothetical protein QM692_15655 [Thermomicrobiales bacterium]
MLNGRRLIESVIIAVVTSTGVYLVGSVYIEAFYGRMSIDAGALDFPPPYIALQAVHAIQSLLVFPVILLLLIVLDRGTAARWPGARERLRREAARTGRAGVLVVNALVALPLIIAAMSAGANRALIQTTSALSEAVSLMQFMAFALLVFVLWLSLGPGKYLLVELKLRKTVPVTLISAVFLLGALVNTADRARANAERLMTGASDASMSVTFTMVREVDAPPGNDLILVAMRNSHYFVVQRQPDPPSFTPRAYAIPFRSVNAVALERINPAPPADYGIVFSPGGSGSLPAP